MRPWCRWPDGYECRAWRCRVKGGRVQAQHRQAQVAELADARDSKSRARKGISVRSRAWAFPYRATSYGRFVTWCASLGSAGLGIDLGINGEFRVEGRMPLTDVHPS
jgi:hypothetical protein